MLRPLAVFSVLILLIPSALAIVVSPSGYNVDFKPNKTIIGDCSGTSGPGCICIKMEEEGNVSLAASGDLAESILLDTLRPVRNIGPFECFAYDIQFPDTAQKAGENKAQVSASVSSGLGRITATVGVSQDVYINVAEKYVKGYEPPIDESNLIVYISIAMVLILLLLFISKTKK